MDVACWVSHGRRFNRCDDDRESDSMKILKTITFPTDIIEEEWATVRIVERNGQTCCNLVLPMEKDIGEERAIRLEMMGMSLYLEDNRVNGIKKLSESKMQ